MPRKYITIAQAAKISGKSQAFIKTLVRNGKIDSHVGRGNVVKIHFESLESYMKRHFNNEEKKFLSETNKKTPRSRKNVTVPQELSVEYDAALKDFQNEVRFYVDCKDGFKGISGTAKDTIDRLIELTIDSPRTAAIMRNFMDSGMRISNMKDFGLTNERKRQIIVKGFNRFFNRLNEFDKLLNKVNEQAEKIEHLTERYNFALNQLLIAESKGFIFPDTLQRDLSLDTRDKELLTPIRDANLSVRAKNCLKDLGVAYLEYLQAYTPAQLMSIRNFGRKSFREVISVMKKHGLYLASNKR